MFGFLKTLFSSPRPSMTATALLWEANAAPLGVDVSPVEETPANAWEESPAIEEMLSAMEEKGYQTWKSLDPAWIVFFLVRAAYCGRTWVGPATLAPTQHPGFGGGLKSQKYDSYIKGMEKGAKEDPSLIFSDEGIVGVRNFGYEGVPFMLENRGELSPQALWEQVVRLRTAREGERFPLPPRGVHPVVGWKCSSATPEEQGYFEAAAASGCWDAFQPGEVGAYLRENFPCEGEPLGLLALRLNCEDKEYLLVPYGKGDRLSWHSVPGGWNDSGRRPVRLHDAEVRITRASGGSFVLHGTRQTSTRPEVYSVSVDSRREEGTPLSAWEFLPRGDLPAERNLHSRWDETF